jgi:hypothetical protein
MHLYFCHYEFEETPKQVSKDRFDQKNLPFRNVAYVEFKTDLFPTEDEIRRKIEFEWKRKKITNCSIIEIYHPEKIY